MVPGCCQEVHNGPVSVQSLNNFPALCIVHPYFTVFATGSDCSIVAKERAGDVVGVALVALEFHEQTLPISRRERTKHPGVPQPDDAVSTRSKQSTIALPHLNLVQLHVVCEKGGHRTPTNIPSIPHSHSPIPHTANKNVVVCREKIDRVHTVLEGGAERSHRSRQLIQLVVNPRHRLRSAYRLACFSIPDEDVAGHAARDERFAVTRNAQGPDPVVVVSVSRHVLVVPPQANGLVQRGRVERPLP
mmetsp:Transcript_4263/g.7339  ORF Transcript_4263/g.7339 Transcript_4263/m.7339 type:complete len:246 (+) Transcript_4263:420-1157(+)